MMVERNVPKGGYRSAAYFGIGLAAAALIVGAVWVRMPKGSTRGLGRSAIGLGMT